MNSTWKSLLWKEWREQRWRPAALTALIMLPALWFFFSIIVRATIPITIGDYLTITTAFANCYVVLAGLFLGMYVAGGENARRTMRFMQALPTPMWQASLIKLLVSWFVAVIPLVLLYTAIYAILPLLVDDDALNQAFNGTTSVSRFSWRIHDLLNWSFMNLEVGVFGVTSLLLWMAAGGVNRSDEVRAGAIGFLTCVSTWMVFALLLGWANKYIPFLEKKLLYIAPALPGGPVLAFSNATDIYRQLSRPMIAIITLFSHGAVFTWYLKRFGHVAVPPNRAGTFEFDLLYRWRTKNTAPMRFSLQAIAWKQLRETGPLAALAVACILMIAPLVYYINIKNRMPTEFGDILGATSLSAGFFVVLVAGIGVFLEDFAPGVNNFWRSRPVTLKLWFIVKYVVGLSVLALAFGSLLAPAYWLQTELGKDPMYWFLQSAFFAIYYLALLYTLSMASYCLLRQPIYAAVMTFGIFLCGVMSLDWLFPVLSSCLRTTIAMILALTIPTTIAYLAVKHDWGWKAGR